MTSNSAAPARVGSANDTGLPARPYCLSRDACSAAKPTTHCRRCSGHRLRTIPEIEAKRKKAQVAYHADPAVKAMLAERIQAAHRNALADPAYVERLREHGRQQYRNHLSRPDVRARNTDPAVRKRAGEAISATILAHIPADLRDEYRQLVRNKRLSAAEARAVIEREVARRSPEAAARRAIADFDRAQRARAEREKAQAY